MLQELQDFGKAIEIAENNLENYNKKLTNLKDYFIEEIEKKISEVKLNGDGKKRLPGNINFSVRGIDAETLLLKLDEKGICVSSGSACSSKNQNPSHVLIAIGLPYELAKGTLRVTLGDTNTKEDVDYLVENLVEIVNELRENAKNE